MSSTKEPRAKTSVLEWVAFAMMIMIVITFPVIGFRYAGLFGGLWSGVFAGVLAALAGVWAVASFVDWIEK